MKNFTGVSRAFGLACCCVFPLAAAAQSDHPEAIKPDQLTYENMPELPKCLTVGVAQGDPMTGPSTVVLKFAAKCDSTMHWHSPNEQLVMVKGSGMFQLQGESPKPVTVGGYNAQPSKHNHRFMCGTGGECLLYLFSDAKFDIHYVDDSGKEISLEQAEKSATKM